MTSDEPTYPGEEGESVEEVLGPDSLREKVAQLEAGGAYFDNSIFYAHADAWEAMGYNYDECKSLLEAEHEANAALREAIDAMLRECGSEPDSRYARNACIIGAAALASLEEKPRKFGEALPSGIKPGHG